MKEGVKVCEEVVGLIGAQDGKRLGAGLHLHLASLLTLFPIGISGGALFLPHDEAFPNRQVLKEKNEGTSLRPHIAALFVLRTSQCYPMPRHHG